MYCDNEQSDDDDLGHRDSRGSSDGSDDDDTDFGADAGLPGISFVASRVPKVMSLFRDVAAEALRCGGFAFVMGLQKLTTGHLGNGFQVRRVHIYRSCLLSIYC